MKRFQEPMQESGKLVLVEPELPPRYAISAMKNNGTLFALRMDVLRDAEFPQWLMVEPEQKGDLFFGDIITVTTLRMAPRESANTVENAPIKADEWPVHGGIAVAFHIDSDDFDFMGVFRDILAMIFRHDRKMLWLADPFRTSPEGFSGGLTCVGRTKVDQSVWNIGVKRSTMVTIVYHVQPDVWVSKSAKVSIRVPEALSSCYALAKEFLRQKDWPTVIRVTAPAIDFPSLQKGWLNAGVENRTLRIPELSVAAAAMFHAVMLKDVAKNRTFKSALDVRETEGATVDVLARADLSKVASENLTGLYKAFQYGQVVFAKFDLLGRNIRLRFRVEGFNLYEEEKCFEVLLQTTKEEIVSSAKLSAKELKGTVASIGPELSSSVPREMRDLLLQHKLSAAICSMKEEDNFRKQLLLAMWNAPGHADSVAPIPDIRDVDTLQRLEGNLLTNEQCLAIKLIGRDLAEVVTVLATAGAGKTEVAIEAVTAFDTGVQLTGSNELMLVSSTMNRPLHGLANKLVVRSPQLKFIMIQSAAFLATINEPVGYEDNQFPALLQELFINPRSGLWTREITVKEKETINLALLSCASIFSDANFNLEQIPQMPGVEDDFANPALKQAMSILLDVYKPAIVVGTLSAVGRFPELLAKVSVTIIDEAGTVSCNSVLQLMLAAPMLRKITFVGDIRQMHCKELDLPESLKDFGYGSILVALANVEAVRETRLTRTFRFTAKMVPILSEAFYDGQMTGGTDCDGLSVMCPWPANVSPCDILVIDEPGEVELSLTKSQGNRKQARAGCAIATHFAMNFPDMSVAVLSYYTHQMRMNAESLGELSDRVSLDNVDRSQGSEYDLVVLTTTSKYVEGDPADFIGDDKRLTVACTRAKKGLIIVADVAAMKGIPAWNKLFGVFKDKGVPILKELPAIPPIEDPIEVHAPIPIHPTAHPQLSLVQQQQSVGNTPSPATLISCLDLNEESAQLLSTCTTPPYTLANAEQATLAAGPSGIAAAMDNQAADQEVEQEEAPTDEPRPGKKTKKGRKKSGR